MLLTLLIILVATDSSSQQSSRYQLYTSAAVSKYLINIFYQSFGSEVILRMVEESILLKTFVEI